MSPIDAAKAVVAGVQQLAAVKKALDENKFNQQIVELERVAIELQRQVNALVRERDELAERLTTKVNPPVFKDGMYYFGPDAAEGPYCPTCWDVQSLKVRLVRCKSVASLGGVEMECHKCGWPPRPRGGWSVR
jgi:hypothetical protein